MSSPDYILINLEGTLDDAQRNAIEDAIDVVIVLVHNVYPHPPKETPIEDYVLTVVQNILSGYDWSSPAFIIRPSDESPVFSALFIEALDAATSAFLAVLGIQYTDEFPPQIAETTRAISLQVLKQRARQFRYAPE